MPSAHVFLDPPGFGDWSRADQVAHRIHDLRAVARHLGHQDLYDRLVAPWRDHGGPTGFPSNRAAAAGAPKTEEASSVVQMMSGVSPLTELTSAVSRANDTLVQLMADCKSGWAGLPTTGPGGDHLRAGSPTGVDAAPLRAAPVIAQEAPAEAANAPPQAPAAAPEAPLQGPGDAAEAPRELPDLFQGDLPEEPWQERRYSADNRIWQAAAMRRRAHARRSNVSLGVCTVDLSGPHEPSPRPGNHIHFDTVTYFLVLSVRPGRTAEKVDRAVQTGG